MDVDGVETTSEADPAISATGDDDMNGEPEGWATSTMLGRLGRRPELGTVPVLIGLVIIAIGFQLQNDNFLTAGNAVNLTVQMAGVAVLAMGMVFVLLLGEIDLSVGFVSGVGGAIIAILMLPGGGWEYGPAAAIVIALAVGLGIGALHGLIITKLGVPSFVVTLAGLLAWSGVVLQLAGSRGTIIIQDQFVWKLANGFLPQQLAWVLLAVVVGLVGIDASYRVRLRHQVGPGASALRRALVTALPTAALGAFYVVVVYRDRGVPYVAVLLLILGMASTYLLRRTRFGVYVYAIGGNAEAARRAGIAVDRIRVVCFMLASSLAVMGGIVLASRLRSVDASAGSGPILLFAVAAPVIGGTSLFGGRGSIYSALLGAVVIATIDNGLGLLGLPSGIKFIVTGLVLLVAVIVDSVARRNRTAE